MTFTTTELSFIDNLSLLVSYKPAVVVTAGITQPILAKTGSDIGVIIAGCIDEPAVILGHHYRFVA
jgi:hypothetical protein